MFALISAQVAWIVFSILAGPEEAAWSWPFRNLNATEQFRNEDRNKQSKLAHYYGWLSVAVIGVAYSYLTTMATLGTFDFLFSFLFLIILICEYSAAFDGSYGVSIGKNIFYIGDTSKTDNIIGSRKGKIKFFACVVIIIIFNIILLNY